MNRRNKSGQRVGTSKVIAYCPLEPRQMLASFTGTPGSDLVIVTYSGGVPVSFEINGNAQANPDPTATLNLGTGFDTIQLLGDSFDVVAGAVSDRAVEVNGNFDFDFDGGVLIETDSGNDRVELLNGSLVGDVQTGGGDDVVVYATSSPNGVGVRTGDGDDRLISRRSNVDDLALYNGGDGFDTFEFEGVAARAEFRSTFDGRFSLGFRGNSGDPRSATYLFIEKVIGEDPATTGLSNRSFISTFGPGLSDNSLLYEIEGNTATVGLNNSPDTVPLILENFNTFRDGSFATIVTTAYETEIAANRIQVGFETVATTGDTSGIVHDLNLFVGRLAVSDFLGDAHQVIHSQLGDTVTISGLSPALIHYRASPDPFTQDVTLVGSDSFADEFLVTSSPGRLSLFGHGGDDQFRISGNLDEMFRAVNSIGGDGLDDLQVIDSALEDFNYRIRERWVHHRPNRNGPLERNWGGAWFDSVENVFMTGTDGTNNYLISAFALSQINYFIDAQTTGLEKGAGDTLAIPGLSESAFFIPDNGTTGYDSWFFGNESGDPAPLRFRNFERVTGLERFAVGAAAGSSPIVRVFSSANTTAQLFDIQAYPESFRGGVDVATGDVTGDAIPDIVVAPGAGRGPLVRIYDGADGSLLHSFNAFESSYLGGVDVEIGNVAGDERLEIVTSRLSESTEFRVFTDRGPVDNGTPDFSGPFGAFDPFQNSPDIGTRITLGDFNFDGLSDVVSAAGPGWRPLVTVYDVKNILVQPPTQLQRFLGAPGSFTGGLNVAALNLVGNVKSELIVSRSGSAGGWFFVYNGSTLPRNNGNFEPAPIRVIQSFDSDSQLALNLYDRDFDGRADFLLTGVEDSSGTGQINQHEVTSGNFRLVDEIFAGDVFANGLNLG